MESLYALKNFLEELAFAGIHNDVIQNQQYRSILDDLKRFETSSPVIGKIICSVELLCDEQTRINENKKLLLLKTLELVNSVIYTQGFTGAEGEFIPLKKSIGESIDIPYYYIEPMISSMNSDDRCDRDDELSEYYRFSPELFNDYRIRRQLVLAMGDLYKPVYLIAQKAIVELIGDEIIPMLDVRFKQDTSSLLRKRIIETIGKIKSNEANNWLKAQLSNKELNKYRADIITALSNFSENQDFLIELAQTEKKSALKAVVRGLRVDREDSLNVLKNMYWNSHSEDIKLLVLSRISEYYKDKQNDWYLKILNKTSDVHLKDKFISIRKSIIHALRYSEKNIDVLVEMAKKKREPCHDEILSDLLYYDSEEALRVWNHELMTSKNAFQKLHKILNHPDNDYLNKTGISRPLLPRLFESIKKYGTNPTDPYPIYIMLEMPRIRRVNPGSSVNQKLDSPSVKTKVELEHGSEVMYQKLQGLAGGKVFGALKSIFNHKGTLGIANTVLDKVKSTNIESQKGQAILSVAQRFISDQNESYQQNVIEKYQFIVDPEDPWSWCLSQLDNAKDERLKLILRNILDHTSLPECTDALVHSIHFMHAGIERRHILLSVLLYMHTQKAKDYWYAEFHTNTESRGRLNIILRNVSNGMFLRSYFNEVGLNRSSFADEILNSGLFRFT